jgi:hypothetical protein
MVYTLSKKERLLPDVIAGTSHGGDAVSIDANGPKSSSSETGVTTSSVVSTISTRVLAVSRVSAPADFSA